MSRFSTGNSARSGPPWLPMADGTRKKSVSTLSTSLPAWRIMEAQFTHVDTAVLILRMFEAGDKDSADADDGIACVAANAENVMVNSTVVRASAG